MHIDTIRVGASISSYFVVIKIFHRGQYGPSTRRNGIPESARVADYLRKPIATCDFQCRSGLHVPCVICPSGDPENFVRGGPYVFFMCFF